MTKSNKNQMFKATYLISSIQEYIDVLKDIKKIEADEELWYRGHNDCTWKLLPNIMRNVKVIDDGRGNRVQPHDLGYISNGQTIAFPNWESDIPKVKDLASKKGYATDNNLELLAFAQHYNMLTPLIDWSEDPLVAMFFAMHGLKDCKVQYGETFGYNNYKERLEFFKKNGQLLDSASILVMNPAKANKYSPILQKNIFTSKSFGNEVIKKLLGYENCSWVCFKIPKVGYRISRQSGDFLLQGKDIQMRADNNAYCTPKIMYKLYIPYENVRSIQEELHALGLTKEAMYGEYDEDEQFIIKLGKQQRKKYENAISQMKIETENIK